MDGVQVNPSPLDALIREAIQAEDPSFVRPTRAMIDAYLLGTASDREREEVLLALSRSSAFRSEMLEAAEDLAAIEEPERAAVATRTPRRASILRSIGRAFARPSLAYALAAAFAALWIAPHVLERDGPRLPAGTEIPAVAPPGRLLVVDLQDTGRMRDGGGEAVLSPIAFPEGVDEVVLRLEIDPVADRPKGSYLVEVRSGARRILRSELRSGELLHGRIIPVVAEASLLRDGEDHLVRVTYAEEGSDLDGMPILEKRFRVRRER